MPSKVPATKAANRRVVYERRLAETRGQRDRVDVVTGWIKAEIPRAGDPVAELERLLAWVRELNGRSA